MSHTTSPSTPPAIADRFDPFSAQFLADPYPTLRELRETATARSGSNNMIASPRWRC